MPEVVRLTSDLSMQLKRWASMLSPQSYPQVETARLQAFRVWVTRLDDEQAAQAARELAGLCALPGFDMQRLVETLQSPRIDSPSARMVLCFGLALYERWNNLPHLKLRSWLDRPRSRENREFGWQLYLRLVEASCANFPGEFLFASPGRRDEIIKKTIHEVYERDYPVLVALTREIIFLKRYKTGQERLKGPALL